MAVDLRGTWRGKMNVNLYKAMLVEYPDPPRYAGPPVDYAREPSVWFGLKISSQFEHVTRIIVISGEAGHYSTKNGDLGLINLPVTGFFTDGPMQDVRLTFYSAMAARPAHFLGYLRGGSHIVGSWTEARQWNEWGYEGRGYVDEFLFGRMSFQKMVSFKDSVESATASHLVSP